MLAVLLLCIVGGRISIASISCDLVRANASDIAKDTANKLGLIREDDVVRALVDNVDHGARGDVREAVAGPLATSPAARKLVGRVVARAVDCLGVQQLLLTIPDGTVATTVEGTKDSLTSRVNWISLPLGISRRNKSFLSTQRNNDNKKV